MAALPMLAIPRGIAALGALPSARIHRFHHVSKPLRRSTSTSFHQNIYLYVVPWDHAGPATPGGGWHGKTGGASAFGVECATALDVERTRGFARGASARGRTGEDLARLRRRKDAHADSACFGRVASHDLQVR